MDGKGDVDAVGGLAEGIDGLVVLGLGLCCCIGGGGSSVRGDFRIIVVAP